MENSPNFRNIKETYKIESTLGKGSFSTVKKCKNRVTGEKFAVKILQKRKMSDEDLQALLTEIEILKQLDHPNIVQLIDVFEDQDHWCLVMELMQGGDLFDLINEKGKFPEFEVREAVKILIDTIRYCHSQEVLHRDIKPENILLKQREQGLRSIKIADFGLARFVPQDQLASTTCGTPGYVAPEILEQKKYGKECDYWSIGVVVFILLSGSPPFFDSKKLSLYDAIKTCQYSTKSAEWNNISDEAKDFVSKIFVADPSMRINVDQMIAHPWMSAKIEEI